MPWRLILFIIIFAVFMVFITFNLDNRCDINLGFYQFDDVPVFLTVFASFIFGLFCALPFALFGRKKHKHLPEKLPHPELLEMPHAEQKPIKEDFSTDGNLKNKDGELHGIK